MTTKPQQHQDKYWVNHMLKRRSFIQGIGALGMAGLTGMPHFSQAAEVNGKRSALLIIMMNGGYAPFQTSALSFIENTPKQMSFGCTSNNITVNDEISYDNSTWGQLSPKALNHMACLGTIGASNHNGAQHFWQDERGGLPQVLAAAMGGGSAIKAAKVGEVAGSPQGSAGGVSLETVTSIGAAMETLTGKGQTIKPADRATMGAVMAETAKRFDTMAMHNPDNLRSLIDGYSNLVKSMTTPAPEIDSGEVSSAYTAPGNYSLNNKLAVAEALMRSGGNVVTLGEGEGTVWDTHDDNDGSRSRALFNLMVNPLSLFCDRMLARDDMNVTVVLMAEHSRIPLINNHGPHLSTIVFSDNVIAGKSTGITDNGGLVLNANEKPIIQWKAALGELVGLKGTANPYGEAKAHRRVIKNS